VSFHAVMPASHTDLSDLIHIIKPHSGRGCTNFTFYYFVVFHFVTSTKPSAPQYIRLTVGAIVDKIIFIKNKAFFSSPLPVTPLLRGDRLFLIPRFLHRCARCRRAHMHGTTSHRLGFLRVSCSGYISIGLFLCTS